MAAQLAALRQDGVPTVFVAAGGLFFDGMAHGEGDAAAAQEIWKAETIADVLSGLQLAAAVPGPLDLRFGVETLDALRARARFPLLGMGVALAVPAADGAASTERPLAGHVVVPVGRVRVGLIGVTDLAGEQGLPAGVTQPGFALEAVEAEARAARAEGASVVLVLAGAPRRTSRRIATSVPGVDFVVQGGLDETTPHPPVGDEGAVVLNAAHHGTGVLVVDLALGDGASPGVAESARWADASVWTRTVERDRLVADLERQRARIAGWERDRSVSAADLDARRAELRRHEERLAAVLRAPDLGGRAFDARFVELPQTAPRDAATSAVLERYFQRVNEHNREAFASRLPVPPAEGRPHFVGSEACGGCHADALSWWRTTLHGHAYRTLQERHREFNLSCVGCHVTGYEQPGGSTVSHVGALADVGCENCHGPGSLHLVDPEGAAVNVRRDAPEEVCARCHTPEHSDRFDYAVYRRMMIAPGHGAPAAGGAPEGAATTGR